MIVLLSSLRCRAAQVLLLLAKELLQEQDRQTASLSVPCRVWTCLFRPVTCGTCPSDTIGPGEAGCFRQVAALHSDHYRQALLYTILLDQGRLAAVDRWMPTVTTIDRLYCTRYYCTREAGCCRQEAGCCRQEAGCCRQEAGCCRQVAAYSDHYRQALLYTILLHQGGWLL